MATRAPPADGRTGVVRPSVVTVAATVGRSGTVAPPGAPAAPGLPRPKAADAPRRASRVRRIAATARTVAPTLAAAGTTAVHTASARPTAVAETTVAPTASEVLKEAAGPRRIADRRRAPIATDRRVTIGARARRAGATTVAVPGDRRRASDRSRPARAAPDLTRVRIAAASPTIDAAGPSGRRTGDGTAVTARPVRGAPGAATADRPVGRATAAGPVAHVTATVAGRAGTSRAAPAADGPIRVVTTIPDRGPADPPRRVRIRHVLISRNPTRAGTARAEPMCRARIRPVRLLHGLTLRARIRPARFRAARILRGTGPRNPIRAGPVLRGPVQHGLIQHGLVPDVRSRRVLPAAQGVTRTGAVRARTATDAVAGPDLTGGPRTVASGAGAERAVAGIARTVVLPKE